MQLITDIGIDLERIKISLRLFLEADKEKSGLLTYTAWCKALLVKPSPLCQKSFSLYDYDKAGRIDFHEFLIALIYLSGVDEAERVRLSFDILDVEGKGFITKAQLLKLLKATFMASDDAEVSSRADSIMEGANEVTFRGFTVMSKKFPNLMVEQYDISTFLG